MMGSRGHPARKSMFPPAPELGPKLSPRRSLRNLRADLAQVELRLRRIEFHVTSGRYELQKEFNELTGGRPGPAR